MRALRLVIALLVGAVGAAPAQLAVSQPTTKLLVLPFQAAGADSATSILVTDAVRDRLGQLAKYKMLVITKKQLCDVLGQSGFSCNGILDDQQAQQLARHLQVHAYTIGALQHHSTALSAQIRILDIGSSGMAANFVVNGGNSAAPQVFAESIAQRINGLIRASEHTRDCIQSRMRSQLPRALAAAQKALVLDPNSVGAHLCVASVYETQRAPIDSIIAASKRALAGDSLNATAWENIARGYQQKNDTVRMIDAFIHQWRGERKNTNKLLGVAQLLRQIKQYQQAVDLLDTGLVSSPGDQQMTELKTRICIEGSLYRCAVKGLLAQLERDSTLARDSSFLKTGIGAAQQAPDTQGLLTFTAQAVRHFPNDLSYLKARGAAFELAGKLDSALAIYTTVAARDPAASLLVAKARVDAAVWDTAFANRNKADTAALGRARVVFATRVDSARPYLRPGLSGSDTTQRLTAAVIMLSGGQKLAQAGAYDRAYPWLDTLLQVVAPRGAADTAGPRFQVRVNASFWYGLSSVLTLRDPFQTMTKSKSCEQAKTIHDRLVRTRGALTLGRRVHPPTADQMLGFVAQYEAPMPQVKKAFKCNNF